MTQTLDQYVSTVSHSAILCLEYATSSIDVAETQQYRAIKSCLSSAKFLVRAFQASGIVTGCDGRAHLLPAFRDYLLLYRAVVVMMSPIMMTMKSACSGTAAAPKPQNPK